MLCLTRTKHAAAPMATTSRAPTGTSLQLPRPIEPTKPLASEPCGPQTANLPLPAPTLHLFASAACSKQRRPPQPNLHSLNSRPAVQCNEGFCNARDGQRLTLTTSTASQKPHNYANSQGENGVASGIRISHVAILQPFHIFMVLSSRAGCDRCLRKTRGIGGSAITIGISAAR